MPTLYDGHARDIVTPLLLSKGVPGDNVFIGRRRYLLGAVLTPAVPVRIQQGYATCQRSIPRPHASASINTDLAYACKFPRYPRNMAIESERSRERAIAPSLRMSPTRVGGTISTAWMATAGALSGASYGLRRDGRAIRRGMAGVQQQQAAKIWRLSGKAREAQRLHRHRLHVMSGRGRQAPSRLRTGCRKGQRAHARPATSSHRP